MLIAAPFTPFQPPPQVIGIDGSPMECRGEGISPFGASFGSGSLKTGMTELSTELMTELGLPNRNPILKKQEIHPRLVH